MQHGYGQLIGKDVKGSSPGSVNALPGNETILSEGD
jgi:hypothetical protein